MTQLVELQKNYKQIKKLGGEVVCVFREEKEGTKGLKKSQSKIKAKFYLLNDLGSKQTAKYSGDSFTTYIIDKQGKIQAILPGTTTKRPPIAKVLKELKKIAPKK